MEKVNFKKIKLPIVNCTIGNEQTEKPKNKRKQRKTNRVKEDVVVMMISSSIF